jgi:hypothetical protein
LKLQNSFSFKVYRGEKISIEELNKWKNTINHIISINNFFLTSQDINLSRKFALNYFISDQFQSVIFQINVNPSHRTIIYAHITNESIPEEEEQILFNLNSIFKILSVDFDLTFQVWKIELRRTDELNSNIDQCLKYVKQEMSDCSQIIYFLNLLLNQLSQIDQTDKYFQMLHHSLPSDHPEIAFLYNGFG